MNAGKERRQPANERAMLAADFLPMPQSYQPRPGCDNPQARFGILPVNWIRRAFCRHGGLFFLVSRRVEIIK